MLLLRSVLYAKVPLVRARARSVRELIVCPPRARLTFTPPRPARRRTLLKTLAYLQTKRPDLEPKPGFMRQLVALDQSLQRVAKANARGKDDPALRKCVEWDPDLVLSACSSARAARPRFSPP